MLGPSSQPVDKAKKDVLIDMEWRWEIVPGPGVVIQTQCSTGWLANRYPERLLGTHCANYSVSRLLYYFLVGIVVAAPPVAT